MLANISTNLICKNSLKFNRNTTIIQLDFGILSYFDPIYHLSSQFQSIQLVKLYLDNIQNLLKMQSESVYPTYSLVETAPEDVKIHIHVIAKTEAEHVPQQHRASFTSDGSTVVHEGLKQTHYVSSCKLAKCSITKNVYVKFSNSVAQLSDFYGIASDFLACHKFSRKQKKPTPAKVYLDKSTKDADKILNLVNAKNESKQHANGRGDEEGVPVFFEKLALDFATRNNLQITVIKGDDLLKEGFRLMHAVGRASKNAPTFINLKYHGNPDSDKWVAFVGKGVCFDTGGLNIKTTAGIKDMHLDKAGAVSVFTAFQFAVKQKLKINLTVSMGFVENYVGSNSYRPSDIIKSRKGLTVEIGNTDAEGRLVLADCMNWTQQNYKKVQVLIELSTLTGAIITALGNRYAGLFTNDEELCKDLIDAGKQVHEESWQMPLVDYHRDIVKHKYADITNNSGKAQASSSQAAAFLEHFVEKDVKWIHLDVAGTAMVASEGTGFGARLLLQYARNHSK